MAVPSRSLVGETLLVPAFYGFDEERACQLGVLGFGSTPEKPRPCGGGIFILGVGDPNLMTGIPALLVELGFATCFFGLPAYVAIRSSVDLYRGASKRRRTLLLVIGACAAVAALAGNIFGHQFYYHFRLMTLREWDVQEIRVGEKQFTSSGDIREVVHALNKISWFTVEHGGWARDIPLTIHCKSGREYSFGAAFYFREKGAVIHFNSKSNPGSFVVNYGDGFSADLPDTLRRMGAALPADERPAL